MNTNLTRRSLLQLMLGGVLLPVTGALAKEMIEWIQKFK